MRDPEVGEQLDQYRLTELLARGGMASVFKAVDLDSAPGGGPQGPWPWLVDGQRPDGWDAFGAGLTIAGMAVILFGPRG